MSFKYRVKVPGFYNGRIYSPVGKRPFLVVEKKFDKCPSWLELVKKEEVKKSVTKKTEGKKSEMTDAERKIEIDAAVNFIDEKVSASGPQVKTL